MAPAAGGDRSRLRSPDPRRSTVAGCAERDCRTAANVDRAVARAAAAGQDDGHPGALDGWVAADRKISLVQNVGAGLEIERGVARDFDPTAIDPRRDGF